MRRRLAALGVALAIVVLASGVVLAASKTVPNDGVFHACYDSGGAVKFIDYSVTKKCPKGWTGPVSWNQSGLIGIKNVEIDKTFDENPDPHNAILAAWMETGSPSEACLATMGEANHAPAVDQLYCSSRHVTFADGSQHWGVYLHVILAGELVDVNGDPSFYTVNVYQEGARFYGTPMKCDLPGCNAQP
jgi:hypothetical protein